MNVAVIDTSTILKLLQRNDESKDVHIQQIWHIIEDSSKVYDMVIIPKTAIDELNDATKQTKRQIFRVLSLKYNIKIGHYTSDNIFLFAKKAAIKFNCPVDIITCDTHVVKPIRCTVEVF